MTAPDRALLTEAAELLRLEADLHQRSFYSDRETHDAVQDRASRELDCATRLDALAVAPVAPTREKIAGSFNREHHNDETSLDRPTG